MIEKILSYFKDSSRLFGSKRSSKWPRIRRNFLKLYPKCAACGSKKKIQVHHITPVHMDPLKELDPDNLISLCDSSKKNCHFQFGHLYSFHSYNENVKEDSKVWLEKISNRP